MSELRCKPGDLCVIVPSGRVLFDEYLKPFMGFFVTVECLCPDANAKAWHYYGDMLTSTDRMLHAVPDENLKPIRPPAPTKSTKTWSPKKQSLLTT